MDKYDIHQTRDGKWQTPPRKNFYRACCDCGLVHREMYRVRQGRIQYRVWRNRKETTLERKRIGKDRANIIQCAVLAALGCTTIDYRSIKKLDRAAQQIARFVEHELDGANK